MRYGFFDANITGYDENNLPVFDRAEDSEFFSGYFGAILTDGIYSSPADGFAVSAGGGMSLSVSPGRCLIQGRFGWQEEADVLTLAAADSNRARIDRVVLRMSLIDRNISLAVLQGEYGVSPSAPALTRDLSAGIWELGLADVSVASGVTEITAANITDLRADAQLCGIVTSPGTLAADAKQITIGVNEWKGDALPYYCVKSVEGVTAQSQVIVSGTDGSMDVWMECGCYGAVTGSGSITFKALYDIPYAEVVASVLIVG